MSFTVKAVHLEPVTELMTADFIVILHCFIAQYGKSLIIWSNHGTNFTGVARELKELGAFLKHSNAHQAISDYCTAQDINWKFIPEQSPHFSGLWEAASKTFKTHLVGGVKLTFEELSIVVMQIEACLNSRPLTLFRSLWMCWRI